MSDVLKDPFWRAQTLGRPLPDLPHACTVSLPTWSSVVGYEEGREKILRKLETGYPRFFIHPLVRRLFARATKEIAETGKKVVLFPHREAAQRALRYVERRSSVAARITSYANVQALVLPEEAHGMALEYWRFSGEILSSRQAGDLLNEREEKGVSGVMLRQALAALTGAAVEDHFVYESGMAAVYAVFRAVIGHNPGKKTLQMEFPYVDSLKVQENFGSGVVFLKEAEGEDLDAALRRIEEGEFAGVFCEIPSNPLLRTVNLARVARACRDGGTPLVVDDTVASVHNVEVLELADLVTTSLTKWISGKGDVMAGSVTLNENSEWAGDFRDFFRKDSGLGSRLYAGDTRALIANMKDFPERMRKSNANAELVADYLAEHPAVGRVWYPKSTSAHEYLSLRKNDGGYGGLLSFTLKNPRKIAKVYDALRLNKGPSFGTNFTLVSPYTMLAHYDELDWAEGCGVSSNLLRVSAGVEEPEVILSALARALDLA